MSTWLVGHTPFLLPVRSRLGLNILPSRVWLRAHSYLNGALEGPSPCSLDIEAMPYPTTNPDADVFEPMSQDYTSISTHHSRMFIPRTSSTALASLAARGEFLAAELLRKELIAYDLPIPHHIAYLRPALRTIKKRRPKGFAKDRLKDFEAWLLLVPDRHVKYESFLAIRQQLFRNIKHLNLSLIYRFGIVVASKGYYSGPIAMQVVAVLARFARLPIVERYLREMEKASQVYQSRTDSQSSLEFLSAAYSRAARTMALRGEPDAAVHLTSVARSRNLDIADFTLDMIAKHAPNQQLVIDQINTLYPLWSWKETTTTPTVDTTLETVVDTTDISTLAARLRSLRTALRSPTPPSPYALYNFIVSYRSLNNGGRALQLLSCAAYRYSPKSTSVWILAEMLFHRSRYSPIYVILAFRHRCLPIGIPVKHLYSFAWGSLGREARGKKEWLAPMRYQLKEKLWPTPYHTSLVWEAILMLSPKEDRDRLYRLLLTLVKQSRSIGDNNSPDHSPLEPGPGPEADRPQLRLSPNTFTAAHFTPFVAVWARAGFPEKAGGVLRDMTELGIQPDIIQWSILARGFAQRGDPAVVFRILDRFEEQHHEREEDEQTKDDVRGLYTNVLLGFVLRHDMAHAREVERRLVDVLGCQPGDRPITDAVIALLRQFEDMFGDFGVPMHEAPPSYSEHPPEEFLAPRASMSSGPYTD